MFIYAVCFDIVDDKSRTKIGKILLEYGHRHQLSVFEIAVKSPAILASIKQRILEHTDETDKVTFYRICAECRKHSFDQKDQRVALFPDVIVL